MLEPAVRVAAIIPTRNESKALPHVLSSMPYWVSAVIVPDFRSTDGTDRVAQEHGAILVRVTRPGYGAACLEALAALPECDIVVFLDGDASDRIEDMAKLVQPIANGEADLVIGSRTLGEAEKGALTPQQRFGNWLACRLIDLIWGAQFSDLGPFRAIRRTALNTLSMQDQTFGWTVEMQIRAVKQGLRWREVPANYRKRIGQSKISGTVKGTVLAGSKILYIVAREAIAA
jgi:glycosyltransferase involved in cell wall biosynthesis